MEESEEGGVSLRFVLPKSKTEATCSEELAFAFETSQENGLGPLWITHDETLIVKPVKTDVFVIDPFEGLAFDHISRFKCTVVGPRCLLTCLQKGEPVPELPYPMYTAAMKGLIVTSTGFSKEKKLDIKMKVERMGGIYSNAFHDGVSHLVAEVVHSKKYDVAVKKETPVMTSNWVENVWERGQQDNIHATDPQFAKFKSPALFGLNITVSQMNRKDRELLKKSIEAHGGIYSGSLDMNTTGILIITKPEGDKYKYARKWKIPCVSSDWVFDSIERGYCLPTDSYKMETSSGSCSTPTKENMSKTLAEVSMCSTIMMPNDTMINVNETINMTNMSIMPGVSGSSGNRDRSVEQMLECLDLSRVKKAGPFLEDCKIYLSGFTDSEVEFLDKVINAANGHRMNQLTGSVTHFVGSRVVSENLKILDSLNLTPYKVSLQWIVESMLMGQPVPESDFPLRADITRTSMGPPVGLPMNYDETLPSRKRDPIPRKISLQDEQSQYEDDLMAQYKIGAQPRKLSEGAEETKFVKPADPPQISRPTPAQDTATNDASITSSQQDTCTQENMFLEGKTVSVSGFDSETESELTDWILETGGEIISKNSTKIVDFLVVPFKSDITKSKKVKEVVTNLWLEDCLDQGRLLPMEYYHRPVPIEGLESVGQGVVIGVTNYQGRERQFIVQVAESLGMISQEIFAKRDKNGAKKSTHLVCAVPGGPKYEAATKWDLPVVTKDWLMACFTSKDWVSEEPFLVGNCKTVTPGKPMPKKVVANPVSDGPIEDEDDEEISFARPPTFKETAPTPTTSRNRLVSQSPKENTTKPRLITPVKETTRVTSNLKTPNNATMMPMDLDTPAGERLDIEKLRPKPIDFDMSAALTPPPQYYADSQPSPSITASQKRKREDDEHLPFFLQGMKTPNTPYGAFLGGNPSPSTRKYWKRQCDELGRYAMTAEQRAEHEAENALRRQRRKEEEDRQEAERKKPLFPTATDEQLNNLLEKHRDEMQRKGMIVLARETRSFDDLMEEKMNKLGRSWKNPGKRIKLVKQADKSDEDKAKSVLKGVVLFVTKKFSSIQAELHEIVVDLGGEFRHSYCPEVTHVIFVGKNNDSTKEFKVAKADKKIIVSPDWVFMCKNEKKLIEEEVFPHTYNPKRALSSVLFAQSSSKPSQRRATQHQRMDEDESHSEKTKESERTESKEKGGRSESIKVDGPDLSAELQKLEEMVQMSNDESKTSKRRSLRMTLSSTDETPDGHRRSSLASDQPRIRELVIKPLTTQMEGPDSQINWVDPDEEEQRKRLAAKIYVETQAQNFHTVATETEETFDSMEVPENLTAAMIDMGTKFQETVLEDKENSQPKNEATSNKPMRFMLSGVTDEEKSRFFEFLNKHGVDHGDLSFCDPDATHVIATKLGRSEKMLGSIASGKWLLHHSYITACMKLNKLLSEVDYEWGNPANRFLSTLSSALEQKLAAASYRWRTIIVKDPRRGIFDGIRAIIHTSDSRKDAFKRLLELGKGVVITDAVPPYRETHSATHCIAEPSKLPRHSIDYATLASQGVAVIGPFYINEYLISDPPPKVDAHIIEEFRTYWQNRRR